MANHNVESKRTRTFASILASFVTIAFTIVGFVAYCAIELTHRRRGW